MAKQMAPDPAIGTWKLNVAKSTFRVSPAIKRETIKIEAWEDGLKISADIVDAQENKVHAEAAYKLDGKDYPIKGHPLADSVSAKRTGERSTESVLKKDGKVLHSAKSMISSDGKTWSLTRTGKDAQGRTVDDLLVFEKQ